jgi:hypothetical protein
MTSASALATLRLEPAVVTYQFVDGNITRHPESHFLDLIVNDLSLRSTAGAAARDCVTELNRPWLHAVPGAVQRLLGQEPAEELAAGRVALLVCAVDGHIGCGQLTAALEVAASTVSWSDFLWEDDMVAPRPVGQLTEPFTFARAPYEAAFADAYARVAAFTYDELVHHGRSFRWPWQWGWRIPRANDPTDADPR